MHSSALNTYTQYYSEIDVVGTNCRIYSFALLMACVFAFGLYYYHRSNNVHSRDFVTDSGHACIAERLRTELTDARNSLLLKEYV